MKKAASILFSLIFLASTLGMTINSHYCGMKLRSVSLVEKSCCCKNKPAEKKGCCKNEVKYVKITDDYSPASGFQLAKTDIAPLEFSFAFPSAICPLTYSIRSSVHSPPPKFPDRVVCFRTFLI